MTASLPDLVNIAKLAREIAMDILPIDEVLDINKVSAADWSRIQADPRFQNMLATIIADWNSAGSTRERVRVKAATAVEFLLEQMVKDILNPEIPLSQRNEAYRQLARLGELEGQREIGSAAVGDRVSININIGQGKPPVVIEGQAIATDAD